MPASWELLPDLFSEGEAAEFQQRDLRRAATIYGRLSQSGQPASRAAALLRLGRVLRASGHHQDALAKYTRMATHGDVRVAGVPADLLARSARLHVLAVMGERRRSKDEAGSVLDDLARSHWALTRGQYEFYRDDAAAVAGIDAAATPGELAIAEAVEDRVLPGIAR